MRWFHLAVIAVIAIAFLIFAFQNLQVVTVAFLGFSIRSPLTILFIVVYVLGMATGGSVWAMLRRSWKESRVTQLIK
ncbi:MAG: hypothetical protein KF810_01270 [Rhizobiaceae bacterium]|nr:hypothetical protein [Rhizobiaceae bacterium]